MSQIVGVEVGCSGCRAWMAYPTGCPCSRTDSLGQDMTHMSEMVRSKWQLRPGLGGFHLLGPVWGHFIIFWYMYTFYFMDPKFDDTLFLAP